MGGRAERKHIIICACSPTSRCKCTPHLHTRAGKRTHTLTARTHARTPHTHTRTHTHTHTYLLGTRTRTPASVLHAGRVALCYWREDGGQFLPGHQPGPAGAQACPPPPALRVITHTNTHTHRRMHAHLLTYASALLIIDRGWHCGRRYLHYLLSALDGLPKEPEGDFFRGVGPEALTASSRTPNRPTPSHTRSCLFPSPLVPNRVPDD